MSIWEEYDFEAKVSEILSSVDYFNPTHHFGKPFLSAYQLAIEFAKKYPDIVRDLGYQIGGKGIGVQVSLAQYIAGQLSRNIKAGKIVHIEGAFLSNVHLKDISFNNQGNEIRSSLTDLNMICHYSE